MKSLLLPLVAGLAVGIALIILFSILQIPEPATSIPTVPRITEEQAAQIVVEDIQKYSPNTTRNDIYLFVGGSKGYVALDEFFGQGMHVPLLFYHQNGTHFRINVTDNTVISACPPRVCGSVFAAVGKLVYAFDMDCGEECGVGFYVIDALKGEVVYTNLPANRPKEI